MLMKHRGMGSIFPRGGKPDKNGKLKTGSWYVRYYRNGIAYQETANSTIKADAEALLKKRIGEISLGQFIPPSDRKVRVEEPVADMILWQRDTQKRPVYAHACQSKWDTHLCNFF